MKRLLICFTCKNKIEVKRRKRLKFGDHALAGFKLLETNLNEIFFNYTEFLERNNLLPENQHGFRAKRSTMTAHTNMQNDWTKNSEEGEKTRILIWTIHHMDGT